MWRWMDLCYVSDLFWWRLGGSWWYRIIDKLEKSATNIEILWGQPVKTRQTVPTKIRSGMIGGKKSHMWDQWSRSFGSLWGTPIMPLPPQDQCKGLGRRGKKDRTNRNNWPSIDNILVLGIIKLRNFSPKKNTKKSVSMGLKGMCFSFIKRVFIKSTRTRWSQLWYILTQCKLIDWPKREWGWTKFQCQKEDRNFCRKKNKRFWAPILNQGNILDCCWQRDIFKKMRTLCLTWAGKEDCDKGDKNNWKKIKAGFTA